MNASEMLEKISETLGSTANVKSVFGEPVQVAGKTVVPVAKVAYGFGGGTGSGPKRNGEPMGEGGGGGGGVRAHPAGALEITENGTRFIGYHDLRWLAGAFAAGAVFGMLAFLRRR